MASKASRLNQLDLVVEDMDASVAFYRHLGFEVHHAGPDHVQVATPGFDLELDSRSSVPTWNRGWKGGTAILGFEVEARQGVDELYSELVSAGYAGQQEPFDAPWGRRYAVVEDPDDNAVGLMSAS